MKTRVLIVVTGGIAAYKCADVVRRLKKAGKEVRVVMTAAATSFVGPLTFHTLSGNAVGLDMFEDRRPLDPIEHISFATWGELVVVCPATANFLAKMAHGLADDLASSTVLASRAPVIACPAMNDGMWDNPATRANVELLQNRGVTMVGPVSGSLACNTEGVGRMAERETIVKEILKALDGGGAV
ncbi:hypothetical protein KBA41_08805 [Candidatus Ozemobacteraceae bacterium]|nr:hypothetical protein [Candidatus Ozemobacteraceae bacterium]